MGCSAWQTYAEPTYNHLVFLQSKIFNGLKLKYVLLAIIKKSLIFKSFFVITENLVIYIEAKYDNFQSPMYTWFYNNLATLENMSFK